MKQCKRKKKKKKERNQPSTILTLESIKAETMEKKLAQVLVNFIAFVYGTFFKVVFI